MDKIARIRQEIERLAKRADRRTDKDHASHNAEMERYGEDYWNGYGDLAYAILSFLDTLSEEPDKSLEEEISRTYHNGSVADTSDMDHIDYENIARHFAEWQKQQDLAEMAQSKSPLSVAYANRCFENGKQAMKEQMLKDAVEGEVVKDISNKLAVTAKGINLDGFKFGQKVRIVIVKEEE